MAYVLTPLSLVATSWLPAAVQWYFITTTTLGYGQNVIFQNPAFRRLAGLPPLVLNHGAVHGNPFANSPTTTTTSASSSSPSPLSSSSSSSPAAAAAASYAAPTARKESSNVFKDALSQVRQTVHAAKGRSGDYVEAAKKEQEAKNLQAWNEKRAEEQRRKFKAELKRKR